jgi:hypothetical protein
LKHEAQRQSKARNSTYKIWETLALSRNLKNMKFLGPGPCPMESVLKGPRVLTLALSRNLQKSEMRVFSPRPFEKTVQKGHRHRVLALERPKDLKA